MLYSLYVVVVVGLCVVSEVEAFCSRPYDFYDWEAQTLVQRSRDADIIVYAEVIGSPCTKPVPLTTTAAPTTETILERIGSLNSTGNRTFENITTPIPTTLPTTTLPPTTLPPTTSPPINSTSLYNGTRSEHNCSFGAYNASLKVHCVIKGGAVPEFITLKELGLSEEMCVFKDLNETESDFHAYNGQNYTFFLKRKHNHQVDEDSFNLHTINVQPATREITDVTSLAPIFKVAGAHAHTALDVWLNKTDPICKPYSGANTLSLVSLTVSFVISIVTMATTSIS